MKNLKVKTILTLATILGLTLGMAGCGGASSTAENGESKGTSGAESDVTVVKCGTAGTIKPFTYTEENGELTGYDVELLRAIFDKLPQYELQFESTEITSITTGIDAGMYQIGACNFSYSDERAEKYQFTDPIFENQYVIAVKEDNDSINSWDDIAGKTTEVSVGTNYTTALEKWNEGHKDQAVQLNYSESDLATTLSNVDSGKYDFQLIDRTTLNAYLAEFGYGLKAIDLTKDESGLIGSNPYAYFLLEKSDEGAKLAEDMNGALAEVIADGTAAQISEEFLGGNYLPQAE